MNRMIARIALYTTLIVAGHSLAPQVLAQESKPQLETRGKALLVEQCSRCHQVEATGESPLPIAPPFHEIMKLYAPEDLEEALAEGLSTGHEAMPEFVFEPQDIAAIIAYLEILHATR